MNIGSGVPATMTWFNGQYVPQADERSPHSNNEAKKGFMRSVERTTKDLQKNIDEVNELIADNKPLNQAKKKQIRDSLSLISYGFSNNASFYLDRYNEATDQIVTQAKNEVETFITSSLVSKGIEALTKEARVIALPEFVEA
jgi:phage tail tape-measure protein